MGVELLRSYIVGWTTELRQLYRQRATGERGKPVSRTPSINRRSARGPLERNAVYPLTVFLKRLGIGRTSLTRLRQAGLPVHFIGRQLYIDGEEAINFLRLFWRTEDKDNSQVHFHHKKEISNKLPT